jgi:hypothetical protein
VGITHRSGASAGGNEAARTIVAVVMAKRKRSRGTAGRAKARKTPEADYDSPWKEALDRYFEPCMAFFFPHAHADISCLVISPWSLVLSR